MVPDEEGGFHAPLPDEYRAREGGEALGLGNHHEDGSLGLQTSWDHGDEGSPGWGWAESVDCISV